MQLIGLPHDCIDRSAARTETVQLERRAVAAAQLNVAAAEDEAEDREEAEETYAEEDTEEAIALE